MNSERNPPPKSVVSMNAFKPRPELFTSLTMSCIGRLEYLMPFGCMLASGGDGVG